MRTRLCAVAGCVVTLALGVSACGSGTAKVAGPTTTTSTAATSSSVPAPASGPELHGVPVKSFTCPRNFAVPATAAVPIGSIEALAVCRSVIAPVSSVNPVLVHPGDADYSTLVTALAEPSQPLTNGVCPAYADAPVVVLAKTGRGVFSIPIPVDGCRHYLAGARNALNQL